MNLLMASHVYLKVVYIVLLFVDDKGGEIYELILWVLMLWLCHVCIIENIWIDDNYHCHICIMPCLLWLPYLHHVKISRTCIVILCVDILPCDEMLWLLKYLKCVHHVKISKSYFKILHIDILPYDELLPLPSFTFEIWKWMSSHDIIHHFQRDTSWWESWWEYW